MLEESAILMVVRAEPEAKGVFFVWWYCLFLLFNDLMMIFGVAKNEGFGFGFGFVFDVAAVDITPI